MSPEFLNAEKLIQEALIHPIISLPRTQAAKYERGKYNPQFSLVVRDGKLVCVWCGNRRRPDKEGKGGEVEIIRLTNDDVVRGLTTEDKNGSGKSWPEVARKVVRYYKTNGLEI